MGLVGGVTAVRCFVWGCCERRDVTAGKGDSSLQVSTHGAELWFNSGQVERGAFEPSYELVRLTALDLEYRQDEK